MSQLGEGVSIDDIVVEEFEEECDERKPVRVRVALFFDGTLNNRKNTEARELHEKNVPAKNEGEVEMLRSFHSFGNDETSYDNGLTNVAKLEKFYEKKTEYDHTFVEYVDGPGTKALTSDSMMGYAFGTRSTGVKNKVATGILAIINQIKDALIPEKDKIFIKELAIDVFGFSRGAAAARHCVHIMMSDKEGGIRRSRPFYKRLTYSGLQIDKDAVVVKFAGLYDTVASYGLDHSDDTKDLTLDSLGLYNVEKTIHLAAADEHRKNFPLTDVFSAANKKEIFLPGVHSDIGGSYLEGSENRVLNQSLSREELEIDKEYLIKQGWYTKKQIFITEGMGSESTDWLTAIGLSMMANSVAGPPTLYKLEGRREKVLAEYSNITLHIMAFFAADSGICIDSLIEMDFSVIELTAQKDRLMAYAQAGGSSASDWLNSSECWLKDMRNKHLHMSAHLKTAAAGAISPNEPNFYGGRRERKTYPG